MVFGNVSQGAPPLPTPTDPKVLHQVPREDRVPISLVPPNVSYFEQTGNRGVLFRAHCTFSSCQVIELNFLI